MNITIVQVSSRNKFPMNLAALAIKFFQKTNYSHYAIKVEDPATGEVNYYDSTGAGARTRSPYIFKKHYELKKSFVVSKEVSYIDWLEFWSKHANKRYGFGQVLGLLLKILNITRHNPLGRGAKRIICNELVILFLNEFGYTNIVDTDSLDLNDTEEILKKVLK